MLKACACEARGQGRVNLRQGRMRHRIGRRRGIGNRQAALQEYRTACDLNPNIPAYKQAYERVWQQVYR